MIERAHFQLVLKGDTADQHEFQGYDGYMALAGFARTVSLVANYVETGKIRQRGDFAGRNSVRATIPSEGSIVADFFVGVQSVPLETFGLAAGVTSASLMYGLVKRVIDRNLGQNTLPEGDPVAPLVRRKAGDVETLVAISEAPIRQTHGVIGHGADQIDVVGGFNMLSRFDSETRDYVKLNVEDANVQTKPVSVAAFNVNSGYGSVFDFDLGRTIPISMSRDILRMHRSIFTWGLDQYANNSGAKIRMTFSRILAMDGTPKRYIVLRAEKLED